MRVRNLITVFDYDYEHEHEHDFYRLIALNRTKDLS